MKIAPWTRTAASEIARLWPRWVESVPPNRADIASAAAQMKALPVYSDFGGTLLISESGEVLERDDESGVTSPVKDRVWFLIALVSAARRFPELSFLQPQRPIAALECTSCSGSGFQMGVLCGRCGGTGWVEP